MVSFELSKEMKKDTRQKKNLSPSEEMNLRPSKPQRPYGE